MRIVLGLLLSAIASTAAVASNPLTETTQLDVVLIRHGVRSPTKAADTYAAYALGEWPAWPVAPGILTPHGHDGMTAIGGRLRRLLRDDGVLAQDCPAAASFVVIGDSTPRNRESAGALVDGMTPGCKGSFLAVDNGGNNALFHFMKEAGKATEDDDEGSTAPTPVPPALAELQTVLLGCTPATCAETAAQKNKKLLLDSPDHAAKAMKLAGTLSENLMLAYAEGMPMTAVGFGRANVAVLGRLIALHNQQFAATKKAMPAAANAASNLVAHIVASLDAARGEKTDVAPLSSSGHGVVVLVGHDTNLANVAGVLGLDWHDPANPDDYPPGGALVFSLVHRGGTDIVRIRSLMPSMDALRTNRFDDVPARPVRVLGCHKAGECTVAEFDALARKAIDVTHVDASLPAMNPIQGENRK
jgi:4-phytase/acid phosphatase